MVYLKLRLVMTLSLKAPDQPYKLLFALKILYLSNTGIAREVQYVERIGKDTLAVVGTEEDKTRLFLQKEEHVEAGQAIHVQADQADIRVFQKTGERIYLKG